MKLKESKVPLSSVFALTICLSALLVCLQGLSQDRYHKMLSPVSSWIHLGVPVYVNQYGSNTVLCTTNDIVVFDNASGAIVSAKQFSGIVVRGVSQRRNLLYIAGDYSDSAGRIYGVIMQYDLASNSIVWQKKIQTDALRMSFTHVTNDSAGNSYVLGEVIFDTTTYFAHMLVMKVDSGGAVAWQKSFGDTSRNEYAETITYHNDREIYISSLGMKPTSADGTVTVWRMDKLGNILNVNTIESSHGPRFSESYAGILAGKFCIVTSSIVGADGEGPTLVRLLDSTLNVGVETTIHGILVRNAFFNSAKVLIAGQADRNSGVEGFKAIKMDKDLNVVASRHFERIITSSIASSANCYMADDGSSFHFYSLSDDFMHIIKTDSNEVLACGDIPFTPSVPSLNYTSTSYTSVDFSLTRNVSNQNVHTSDFNLSFNSACDSATLDESPLVPLSSVVVYPDPATTELNIQNLPTTDVTISIVNVLGETVFEKMHNGKIDVSRLRPGVYMLSIAGERLNFRHKFIKI